MKIITDNRTGIPDTKALALSELLLAMIGEQETMRRYHTFGGLDILSTTKKRKESILITLTEIKI